MTNHNKLFIGLKNLHVIPSLSLSVAPTPFNHSRLKVWVLFNSLFFIFHLHVHIFSKQNKYLLRCGLFCPRFPVANFSLISLPPTKKSSLKKSLIMPFHLLNKWLLSYHISCDETFPCIVFWLFSTPHFKLLPSLPKYRLITTNLFNKYLNCTYSSENCTKCFINKY